MVAELPAFCGWLPHPEHWLRIAEPVALFHRIGWLCHPGIIKYSTFLTMYSDKVIVSDFYGLQKVLTMYRLRKKENHFGIKKIIRPLT